MTPCTVDILLFAAKRGMVFFVILTLATILPILTFAEIPNGAPFNIAGRHLPLQSADLNVGLLFFPALSSISVFGVTSGDMASNSKYSRHVAVTFQRPADTPELEATDPTGTAEYPGNRLVAGPEIMIHGHTLSDYIIGRKCTWKA